MVGRGGISHHESPRKARERAETAPSGGPVNQPSPEEAGPAAGGSKPPAPSLPLGGPQPILPKPPMSTQ